MAPLISQKLRRKWRDRFALRYVLYSNYHEMRKINQTYRASVVQNPIWGFYRPEVAKLRLASRMRLFEFSEKFNMCFLFIISVAECINIVKWYSGI